MNKQWYKQQLTFTCNPVLLCLNCKKRLKYGSSDGILLITMPMGRELTELKSSLLILFYPHKTLIDTPSLTLSQ